MFQCSSASRKFLNPPATAPPRPARKSCFSALQRAENSSIVLQKCFFRSRVESFSALQRAENSSISTPNSPLTMRSSFSALQRAENSSIGVSGTVALVRRLRFSALQRAENSSIPRLCCYSLHRRTFQCSSASRKFLNNHQHLARLPTLELFQCSSASRKFLNSRRKRRRSG